MLDLAAATNDCWRSWCRAHRRAIEGGARRGAVHEWRVATRRLLAALALTDAASNFRSHRKAERLVRCAFRATGRLRDVQVCILFAMDYQSHHAAAEAFQEWLRDRLPKLRARVVRRLQELDTAAVAKCVRKLRRTLAENEEQSLASAITHVAAARRTLAHSGEAVSRQTPLPALHELRVEIKRLRYAAEFLRPFLRTHGDDDILRLLPAWQDSLGDILDREVLVRMIERYRSKHSCRARVLDPWQMQLRREQRKLVARFVQHWLALRRLEEVADEWRPARGDRVQGRARQHFH
jgi:CHAD domain-containing protein